MLQDYRCWGYKNKHVANIAEWSWFKHTTFHTGLKGQSCTDFLAVNTMSHYSTYGILKGSLWHAIGWTKADK